MGGSNGIAPVERRDGARRMTPERRETNAPDGDEMGEEDFRSTIATMRDIMAREAAHTDRRFDALEKRQAELERKYSALLTRLLIGVGVLAGVAYGPDLLQRLMAGFVTGGP